MSNHTIEGISNRTEIVMKDNELISGLIDQMVSRPPDSFSWSCLNDNDLKIKVANFIRSSIKQLNSYIRSLKSRSKDIDENDSVKQFNLVKDEFFDKITKIDSLLKKNKNLKIALFEDFVKLRKISQNFWMNYNKYYRLSPLEEVLNNCNSVWNFENFDSYNYIAQANLEDEYLNSCKKKLNQNATIEPKVLSSCYKNLTLNTQFQVELFFKVDSNGLIRGVDELNSKYKSMYIEGQLSLTPGKLLETLFSSFLDSISFENLSSLITNKIKDYDKTMGDNTHSEKATINKQDFLKMLLNDYLLKANGFEEYFYGLDTLLEYSYFQNFIYLEIPLQLSLVKKKNFAPNNNSAFSKYSNRKKESYEKVALEYGEKISEKNYFLENIKSKQKLVSSLQNLNCPFRLKIKKLLNMSCLERSKTRMLVFVKIILFYGNNFLNDYEIRSEYKEWNNEINFNKYVEMIGLSSNENNYNDSNENMNNSNNNIFVENKDMKDAFGACLNYNEIPRETKIAFLIYSTKDKTNEKHRLLAYVVQQLIDPHGFMLSGIKEFGLWKVSKGEITEGLSNFLFRSSNSENRRKEPNSKIVVDFGTFFSSIFFNTKLESRNQKDTKAIGSKVEWDSLHQKTKFAIRYLVNADPLYTLTPNDKSLLWLVRHYLVNSNLILAKFIQSVNWKQIEHRIEAYKLLQSWEKPSDMVQALEILNMQFHDSYVRKMAVDALEYCDDEELKMYMLQITQCLKYESYHSSPLAKFLVKRAKSNFYRVGHSLFWSLKAEMEYAPRFFERYCLILEEFLVISRDYLYTIQRQVNTIDKLRKVAEKIKKLKSDKKANDNYINLVFKEELERLNNEWFDQIEEFQNPADPSIFLGKLVIEKCKYFSSKMVPLYLVFENKDQLGKKYSLIFKCGDDLRQDALTLQLLRIMDRIWMSSGMDMRLSPYHAVALGAGIDGKGIGVLEAVTEATTTSAIQVEYGGSLIGALKINTIDKYIKKYNNDKNYEKAVKRFAFSCAAYCVATFILGIGDRHNGNIMIKRNGKLFHIDFGHFLGNFKTKYGIKRERAAFVFLPEMGYAMGGSNYMKSSNYMLFKNLSTKAFNKLRLHDHAFITLFDIMVGAKMPELMKKEDIHYLKEMLYLEKNSKEAADIFKKELTKSLNATSRRFDNLIHNLKHGWGS